MIVLSYFLFTTLAVVLKYFWDHRRFYFLLYKIPSGELKYYLKDVFKLYYYGGVKFLMQFGSEYFKNKKTVKFFFGSCWVAMPQTPEDINTVMYSKDCLDKGPIQKVMNADQGLIFGHLNAWHRHRKLLEPFFNNLGFKNFIPKMNQKSLNLTRFMEKRVNQKEFNVYHDIAALTLEMILHVMDFDIDLLNMQENERNTITNSLQS